MSVTVRLWSKEQMEALPGDPHALTVFMNHKTFSEDEFPYQHRYNSRAHTYQAFIGDDPEPVTFRAVDDESALWFLAQEYTVPPDALWEVITTTRDVTLP